MWSVLRFMSKHAWNGLTSFLEQELSDEVQQPSRAVSSTAATAIAGSSSRFRTRSSQAATTSEAEATSSAPDVSFVDRKVNELLIGVDVAAAAATATAKDHAAEKLAVVAAHVAEPTLLAASNLSPLFRSHVNPRHRRMSLLATPVPNHLRRLSSNRRRQPLMAANADAAALGHSLLFDTERTSSGPIFHPPLMLSAAALGHAQQSSPASSSEPCSAGYSSGGASVLFGGRLRLFDMPPLELSAFDAAIPLPWTPSAAVGNAAATSPFSFSTRHAAFFSSSPRDAVSSSRSSRSSSSNGNG